jgi:hypothetical protein
MRCADRSLTSNRPCFSLSCSFYSSHLVQATAVTYCHRYFAHRSTPTDVDAPTLLSIIAASVLLASKTEEVYGHAHHRGLQKIADAAIAAARSDTYKHIFQGRDVPVAATSAFKNLIIQAERDILTAIAFDFDSPNPFTFIDNVRKHIPSITHVIETAHVVIRAR